MLLLFTRKINLYKKIKNLKKFYLDIYKSFKNNKLKN